MLVCNVSAVPLRAPITVEIAEAGAAAAVSASTGNIFTVLIDNPVSALEFADAYFGETMSEAASASATVDAGLVYTVLQDEPTTASDSSSAAVTGDIDADMAEAATADSAQDGTVVGAVTAWSAMLPGVYVNADISRQANVSGIMVNV